MNENEKRYEVIFISHLGRTVIDTWQTITMAKNDCDYLNRNYSGIGHYKVEVSSNNR